MSGKQTPSQPNTVAVAVEVVFVVAVAVVFVVVVILNAVKDPEEFHSPELLEPFQPVPLAGFVLKLPGGNPKLVQPKIKFKKVANF
jgi:hypothetical protein